MGNQKRHNFMVYEGRGGKVLKYYTFPVQSFEMDLGDKELFRATHRNTFLVTVTETFKTRR